MIRLPLASASNVQPGGTTVVLSVCSTTAGPATETPCANASRNRNNVSIASCPAVNTCTAVGVAGTVRRWNGTSWSAKPSADPGGSATSLVAVGAGSYKDVWAVGDATNNSTSVTTTVAEQWNGTAWKILPTPNPTGSKDASLTGVSVISAASAWAVGYSWNGTATSTVIEHWNGTTWKLTKAPS